MDKMDFSGKRVLVTGGAVRVGAGICRSFAEKGAQLVIHCRSHIDEARALAAELPGSGHRVVAVDLAQGSAAIELLDEAGGIDILVNNASLYYHYAADSEESAKAMMQVNYFTPKSLMEKMLAAAPGSCVVNILDQEVLACGGKRGGAYSEARRLLAEATLEYAVRGGARDIRFNAVAPGPMIPPSEIGFSKMEKSIAALPLRRKVEISDLADAVLFLAQNRSITGAILPVDCGQSLACRCAEKHL